MTEKKAISVVQHNKLIEARYSLTVGEQRLILAMISKIKQSDDDFSEYTITLNELASLLDVPLSYIYNEINQITERLMSRIIHIKLENGDLMKLQWVCTAIHKKDCIILSFAPKLKPYLLKLQREFTITDISIIRKFQSIYSIRIYQLLKQYVKTGWRKIELQELREILGIGKNQYREFYDLKKRILFQAQREFQKPENQCDINFDFETIKEGRRIVRLKFFIQQQAIEQDKPLQPSAQSTAAAPTQSARINRIPFEHDEAFGQWLAKKGLSVDLLQWAESGKNSTMCKVSYNDFLQETGRA